jgi:hypothetical protein
MMILILLGAMALQVDGAAASENDSHQEVAHQEESKPEAENAGTGEKIESDKATKKKDSLPVFSIDCHVQGEVGKDLADAKVAVTLSVSEGQDQAATNVDTGKTLKELTYKTDAKGRYRIDIPSELAENPILRLSVVVEHPDYLRRAIGPLPVRDFNMQEIDFDQPFWSWRQQGRSAVADTTLRRSHPLRGRLLLPNGSPAVGAKVRTWTKYRAYSWKIHDPQDYTSIENAVTDEQGWFEIATDSPAVLHVNMEGEAPLIVDELSKYRSPNSDDPANTFRLPKGIRPHGQVLTFDGKPISGAIVYASRDFKWDEFDMPTGLSRSCAADEHGKYELPPLPAGAYRLSVSSRIANLADIDKYNTAHFKESGTYTGPDIPTVNLLDVIVDQTKTIGDIDPSPACDFQAIETVVVTAQMEFSDGKRPDDGRTVDLTVVGLINGNRWNGISSTADEKGIARLVIPRGTQDVVIGTGLARFKRTAEGPIELGENIYLGPIYSDVAGITVIRPKLAKLKVKLQLPDELSRQYGQSKAFIDIHAHHNKEATKEQAARSGKQHLSLSGAMQRNSDQYQGTALPNEEVVLQVTKRVDGKETLLHEERLTLEPGEERLREIEIHDATP